MKYSFLFLIIVLIPNDIYSTETHEDLNESRIDTAVIRQQICETTSYVISHICAIQQILIYEPILPEVAINFLPIESYCSKILETLKRWDPLAFNYTLLSFPPNPEVPTLKILFFSKSISGFIKHIMDIGEASEDVEDDICDICKSNVLEYYEDMQTVMGNFITFLDSHSPIR